MVAVVMRQALLWALPSCWVNPHLQNIWRLLRSVLCSLENYIILTLMHMQSICIERTILRVNSAILCFPLKKCSSQTAKMSKLLLLPLLPWYNTRMSLSFRWRCHQLSALALGFSRRVAQCAWGSPKEAKLCIKMLCPLGSFLTPLVTGNGDSSVTCFHKLICSALSFSFLFYFMFVFFLILAFFICISFS